MARQVTYRVGLDGFEAYREGIDDLDRTITVDVHELDAAPWPVGESFKHVGHDVPRLDGPAKATGMARYSYDMQPPGLAFAGLVTSPHAHAEVKAVDVARAKALPGVLSVKGFAGKRVTYPGAIVAIACAESEEALSDALAAIQVTYDIKPVAVTVDDAMAKDAPQVDKRRPNLPKPGGRGRMERGDAAAAWDAAAVKVEAEYRTSIQTHSCLEPHGCVVQVTPEGEATVWASTQATSFFTRGRMQKALGVPANKTRTVTHHMGGGFGSKFGSLEWDVLCAELAQEHRRPVRMMLTRRDEHLVGGNRPDSIQQMRLGGSADGTFTVLRGETFGTAGNGGGGAGCANFMVYDLPNLEMQQRTVRTFTARAAAFRAPRHPQGFFALESAIDLYAAKAGLDPLAVRQKNDPHPIRQVQWRIGAERIGWAAKRKAPRRDGPWHYGVGCASSRWAQAGRGNWRVDLVVHADGTVTVRSAVQDIGTGVRTVLAILVAEELALPIDHVRVEIGDTTHPAGPGSGGSTTTPSIGPAAREAAHRAREAVGEALAEHWGVKVEDIRWEGGRYLASEGREATFAKAAAVVGDEGLAVHGTRRANWEGYLGETAGCQFAEVAVDVETGIVRVAKVVAVHDCGRIVNGLAARSQVNGAVIQGVSYALHEERQLDRTLGDMVNPTFDTYRISGMQDCPQIDAVMTSVVSGFNNTGLMGLGEPAAVPTAGAIANAVFHAIGVQVPTLPMTSARVLEALEAKAEGRSR